MAQYYTPFLSQAGQAIGRGLEARGLRQQKQQQDALAGSAYMGDPKAMDELMQVNPELGAKIQASAAQRKQAEEQKSLQKRTQFTKEYNDIMENIAKFDSFEDAKKYADSRIPAIAQNYPEIMAQVGEDEVFDEEDFNLAKKLTAPAEKRDEVQSSKILPGGLVQQVMKSGEVRTVEPEQENIDKIKEAEERGAELQGLRAGERGAASGAIKQSIKAFEGMAGARKNISLYDEGIKLLEEEGANTGPIEKMFPSFKAATVKLDNIQDNLGLNVIQNTTFGSLSEQELKFALDSTMPQGLNPEQLSKWMKDKREAQMKLANYLEEAAIFLGTPGNTVADFLRQKRTQQFVGEKDTDEKAPAEQETYEQRKARLLK